MHSAPSVPFAPAPRPQPQPIVEPQLTFGETAELIAASRRTVERLAESGELRTVKIGQLVRVDPRDLRAFLDARKS